MQSLISSCRPAGSGSRLFRLLRAATALPLLCASLLVGSGCASSPAAEASAPTTASAEPATPEGAPRAEEAAEVSPAAIVEAPDRTAEDRQADERRQPARLLEFLGVGRGERVADLGAGSGYTTELLARAVGPAGTVYAQNDK